jgi:hypothetical protein
VLVEAAASILAELAMVRQGAGDLLRVTRVLQFTLPACEGLKAFPFGEHGELLVGVALFPEPGAAAAAAAAVAGRGTPAFGWGIGINMISVAKAE